MITELTEDELEEARLWCGVCLCVQRLRMLGKCQLKPEADTEFNKWALTKAAGKLIGVGDSGQKFEDNFELFELLLAAPVREALGLKFGNAPLSHSAAQIISGEARGAILVAQKRQLASDEPVVVGDVCYYKGSDTYFTVAAEWVGRTLATWPKGRQPYCIWRME